jgi:hypothetical protein
MFLVLHIDTFCVSGVFFEILADGFAVARHNSNSLNIIPQRVYKCNNLCTAVYISIVQKAITLRQPGLIFVYET